MSQVSSAPRRQAVTVGVDHFVDAGGEDAEFQAGDAEQGLLGEDNALDGEEFPGIDGLADGGEVGLEFGDDAGLFKSDDGEVVGGESVFTGVLGGAGLALGRGGSRGFVGVGAVSGEAFGGNGLGVFMVQLLHMKWVAGAGACK